MRRLSIAFTALALQAVQAHAQAVAETPASGAGHTAQHADPWVWWKLANFIILIAVLWWLLRKSAPAFFESRSKQIAADLADSARARQEAEQRVAGMERRIAGLNAELERLRTEMRAEMAAEGERIRKDTEAHIDRMQRQAEQEIENMTKTARRDLRLFSAKLALDSAASQIKSRMSGDVEHRLVSTFVDSLKEKNGAERA